MTTAARPTFEPARGGRGKGEGDLSAMSKQYSSRDLPSHTKLKHRQEGQGTAEETRARDFRKELEEKEKLVKEKKVGVTREASATPSLPSNASAKRPRIEGASGAGSGGGGGVSTVNLDADDPVDDDDEDDDDDESDDEDDTAELMAELQRIKKERSSEKSKKDEEERVEQERIRTENILHGNPLLNKGPNAANPNFKVARRWDDDVVFKNCAKNFDKNKKEFINDSLRSEFHKKFMDKYIK